jgi:aryl-alcohol dehydrogenase-like predicted oxidoreductase
VAAAHDAKPAQIGLAWLVRLPQVVVIPGASSVEQLEFNAAAAELDLTDDEHSALTAAARAFTPQSTAHTVVDGVRERIEDLVERVRG